MMTIYLVEHVERALTHFSPNLAALNKSRASKLESMFNTVYAEPLELTFLL